MSTKGTIILKHLGTRWLNIYIHKYHECRDNYVYLEVGFYIRIGILNNWGVDWTIIKKRLYMKAK